MAACGCAGRAALGSGNTRACCEGTVLEECPERHEAKSGDVQTWWYASDVLDIICYEFLPDADNIEAPRNVFNWIVPDMAGLVIITADFNIGMTEYEFASNLGIIAQSGTKVSMEAEAACGGCFTKASIEAAAACGGCFTVRQDIGGSGHHYRGFRHRHDGVRVRRQLGHHRTIWHQGLDRSRSGMRWTLHGPAVRRWLRLP
mmetsp:Transcript_72279/g.234724  ORF Transcript_72279/g.234724 Transcript_72279/m.234724 type:complete len:202 (+) Transcript_72279:72-677(+)